MGETQGMKILHLAAGNLYGGVERLLITYHEVSTAEVSHEFAFCYEGKIARELSSKAAVVHLLPKVRLSRPWTVIKSRRALRALVAAQAYDAVIFHGCWQLAVWGKAVSEGRRAMYCHDLFTGVWLERLAARVPVAHLLANSRITGRSAEPTFGRLAKVVYPPVLSPKVRQGRTATRKDLGIDPATFVVFMASRLEAWKGHELLLDALAGLEGDWQCLIAGGAQRIDEKAYLDRLISHVNRLHLAGKVRFLGQRDDIGDLLAAADAYCQPNTHPEPFGIIFMEARLVGLPVITCQECGARECLNDPRFIRTEPAQLAPALRQVMSSERSKVALSYSPKRWVAGLHAALQPQGPLRDS